MPEYQTHSVPISFELTPKETTEALAAKLNTAIASYEKQGWDYYRLETVETDVNPGCLGAMFGQKASTTHFHLAIFRRPI